MHRSKSGLSVEMKRDQDGPVRVQVAQNSIRIVAYDPYYPRGFETNAREPWRQSGNQVMPAKKYQG